MSQTSTIGPPSQRQHRFADECVIGQVFHCPPIYNLIFSCVSPGTLVRIGLSCRAAYIASRDFSQRAFNIHRHLSRFIVKPLAFRSLQARTGTLIAGSNVLQFLDRTFYPEADMDLYVHPGHTREVLDFIVEREGYRFKPHSRQRLDYREIVPHEWDGTQDRGKPLHYRIKGVKSVFSFEKHGPECPLKIQIIECAASPFDTIINFHSTCVMNFITFDAAYSLYPVATFEERNTLQVWRERPFHDLTVVNKYSERGFTWFSTLTASTFSQVSSFHASEDRTVGDRYTWKVALNIQGVDLRPPMNSSSSIFQCDPVIYNGWSLLERDEGIITVYNPIESTLFRYNYSTANAILQFELCRFMLRPCLRGRMLPPSNDPLEKERRPWFVNSVLQVLLW
ncbi:hypothetical protein BD769DRAFT_1355817 [Suillus cothurnatus]|nr:hypothetical protein BD769DRAFT_1355817 [Suillus cothurnatus]